MSLLKYDGNTITKHPQPKVVNSMEDVEIDYYFMAQRFAQSKTEISMKIWTVIIDSQGLIYGMKTKHWGHYEDWQTVIQSRLKDHLQRVGVDSLIVKRMVRDIPIEKEGHIIKWDYRCTGDKIGITGGDEIYVRKDKFNYYKSNNSF